MTREGRGGGWVAGQLALLALLFSLPSAGPAELRALAAAQPARLLSLALAALAVVLFAGGALALGRNLTPYPKPLATTTLVRRGLYARVRHPIYGGLIVGALAVAVERGSLLHAGLALALAALLRAKSAREERWLAERFPDYDAYRKTTRRFLPGVW